jgi:hypothetical protein
LPQIDAPSRAIIVEGRDDPVKGRVPLLPELAFTARITLVVPGV